ncbi:potassium-transporting ATPase subunit KdpC [Candidatus Nitrospira nitrificans]|uniref:Potassium-transporting ATPase KdpC subunit n=1 Tax=Candidatus Nitrospira nitrificans TaxID=1742973 RepID=A0A0S4LU54_9BACT|nr:potassium-transporting ATPase subunit KdpC [Candidatus Nitrospira nitrificans]CUS39398.1 potassium translocating ATPase, subunit C [Candidatus Nitrospira nitrificans]
MKDQMRPALTMLLLLTVLTGLLYPLAVTGIAHTLFPEQANGSLIAREGKVIGSALIGQYFDKPEYFWSRPSATSPFPYNAAASGGSNLGPTNQTLIEMVKTRVAALRGADPSNDLPMPVDLVTASGSGLDLHISPAAALYQVKRVARARGLDETLVQELVSRHTEERQFGLLGERRVNVLRLNLALDALHR